MDLDQKYRNLQVIPKIRRIALDYKNIKALNEQLNEQYMIDEKHMVFNAERDALKALKHIQLLKKDIMKFNKEIK